MARIRIGTSGYDYPHFRGVLYPPKLPRARWLGFYARVFPAVELNATFYRLPVEGSAARWQAEVPAGFRFAVKGSRFLTHMKRLLDTGPGVKRFFSAIEPLTPKLGPVLWQLPPRMKPDLPRLRRFLRALPPELQHVVEFRDPAWYLPEVCELLDELGVAFCEHDLVDADPPRLTGPIRYLRFHGVTAPYQGRYGPRRLREVAASLRASRRPAWVFFNNDTGGHAVRDALELSEQLGEPRAGALADAAETEGARA